MSELTPLLIFFFTFSLFLLLQSIVHARRWKQVINEPIPLSFKNLWAGARLLVYIANAAYYVSTNIYPLEPNVVYEIIRLTLLQLSLFWIIYDILLPLLADKPQLWDDPSIQDNNSPYDRIGGDWIGNLFIKLINVMLCIAWITFTNPGEFIPFIPNYITLIGGGVVSFGILIAYIFKIKLMNYSKISIFDLFTQKFGRRSGMVLIFLFSMVFFPTLCLLIAGVISAALDSDSELFLNIGGTLSFVLVMLSINIAKLIKLRRPDSFR
jgi:hypothetical protein